MKYFVIALLSLSLGACKSAEWNKVKNSANIGYAIEQTESGGYAVEGEVSVNVLGYEPYVKGAVEVGVRKAEVPVEPPVED
jgi:hypothetical protein